jgi:hypothetical protein
MALETLHGLSHLVQLGIFGIPALVVLAIVRRFVRFEGWLKNDVRVLNGLSIAGVLLFILGVVGDGMFSAQIVAGSHKCLTNLQQIARGLSFYAQDWSDTYPPLNSWSDRIRKYEIHEKDFQCPSAKSRFSYALNSAMDGRSLSDIPYPADTVLAFEMDAAVQDASGDVHTHRPTRHMGASNMTFTNGNSKWMNEYSSQKVRWKP